jgi:hypothetical protein
MGGQHYAPAALPMRRNPQYLLNRRLDGPQGRSGRFTKESNSLAYVRIRTPDPPAHSSYCFRATESQNKQKLFIFFNTIHSRCVLDNKEPQKVQSDKTTVGLQTPTNPGGPLF